MAASQELRRRIKSVSSTRQITKAMEMVSAAKMRKASETTLGHRPYALKLEELAQRAIGMIEEYDHPLLTQKKGLPVLLVIIASDRGLAGAFNSNVVRKAIEFITERERAGTKVRCITMGEKARTSLVRAGISVLRNYPLPSTTPLESDIHALLQFAVHEFEKGTYGEVRLMHNRFTSMLAQEAVEELLLPLQKPTGSTSPNAPLFEPSPSQVLDRLLPFLAEIKLYQSLLESIASEHSARRLAMKSASDNAKTVTEKLTLTYNRLRQGAITQEIAEITSGSAAIEA
jgi:F-type H+-transporting ATPase subunit gamma